MFDPGLLRTFVAVVDTGGFTNAAKLLNSTPSTVSAQVQRLEDEAGCLLFVRSTRSVQLTSAGDTLLGYARTILHLNEDAQLRLSGAPQSGRVRVGTSEDFSDSWLPKVLQRFGRQYPEVEVEPKGHTERYFQAANSLRACALSGFSGGSWRRTYRRGRIVLY